MADKNPASDEAFFSARFDVLRNAIYHTERRAFFDFVNRGVNFLVVVLSAGVAGKAAGYFHFDALWLELAVVTFATAQLVFDFGARAATHGLLQKRYYELAAEIETQPKSTPQEWSARLLTISADEPIAMRALDALAYNKAVDAQIADPAEAWNCRLHVPWLHQRLRHVLAFQSAHYETNASHRGVIKRCRLWWQRRRGARGEEKAD